MNSYYKMRSRHAQEFYGFPHICAFTQKNLLEGMKKLGVNTPKELFGYGDTGLYFRVTDRTALDEMFERQHKEITEAILNDGTGNGFIYDMFLYELNAHEYRFTQDIEDTLEALGITQEQIVSTPNLKHGLEKACRKIIST